jgi:hypothetical protein
MRAQLGRLQHLAAAGLAQDVADQLAVVAVRQFEQVAAIRQPFGLLFRMPLLAADPARAQRTEPEPGPGARLAAEDAVAGLRVRLELFCIDVQ